MQHQNLTPVSTQERIQTIDIIRALALLGVVVANFTVDNQNVAPAEGRTWFIDQLVYWPIRFFIDDKAMAMYCFLFGLGFAIQMLRAKERKAHFVFMYIRRMIVLFLIGIVALILTWETIPHEYAMVGLLLLLFYKIPRKFLLLLAILCVLVPFTRHQINLKKAGTKANATANISVDTALLNKYAGVYRLNQTANLVMIRNGNAMIGEGPRTQFNLPAISDSEFIRKDIFATYSFHKDSTGEIDRMLIHGANGSIVTCPRINTDLQEALQQQLHLRAANNKPKEKASYKQFIVSNAKNIWERFSKWSWSDFFWGSDITDILPLFLIGLYAGRRKLFYEISANREFLKKTMWWGFIIGIIGQSINMGIEVWNLVNHIQWRSYYTPATRSWIQISWELGILAMTLAYISGLILLLENTNWKKRLSFLAPVGRMGLTNYLLHTIPYVMIFHYGLDLSGKIGPFYRLLFALPVYAALIFLSHWWFKHFRIGPAEWLWRSLTYLKFQPMRLKTSEQKKA